MSIRSGIYLVVALCATASAQPTRPYSYQILYTGRTLGYARNPDGQSLTGPNTSDPNPVDLEYKAQFESWNEGPKLKLRLGMGDNLAPQLLARTFSIKDSGVKACNGETSIPPSLHLPKDMFLYEDGYWKLWCEDSKYMAPFYDNAAQFFVDTKYDAVVPGKHDLYLGAQHLRLVASFLRERKVQMLAENLIMATTLAPDAMNAHPRIPERFARECHDNTGPHACYHTDFGQALLDLPDNVLPWKRQFVLRGARRTFKRVDGRRSNELLREDEVGDGSHKASAADYDPLFDENRTYICAEPGPTVSDPSKAPVPPDKDNCFPLVASDSVCLNPLPAAFASTCKSLYGDTDGVFLPEKVDSTPDVTFLFKNLDDHLRAGVNHMFCTYDLHAEKNIPVCQPFPVQVPLFWSAPDPDSIKPPAFGAASCDQMTDTPCPYLLVNRDGGTVAVFGVVDPDLLTNVGMLNTSWLNTRRKWDTQTQVAAPDYALKQTLELCNASEACRTAPKVLMAQMSYARASHLVAAGPFASAFDVVISQASLEHYTGAVKTSVTGNAPRFVLTPPWPMGEPPNTSVFVPQVYAATISRITTSWTLENETPKKKKEPAEAAKLVSSPKAPCLPPYPTDEKQGCWNLDRYSQAFLKQQHANGDQQALPVSAPAASNAFVQATLLSLRKAVKADVVMIQTRDVWDADKLSYESICTAPGKSEVQDQIGRILWKDDFVVRLHVTGATIRKLLKQSAAFKQLDKNLLSTEIETGRSLITLGLYTHPYDPDTYYINGAMMDDTALYTIAATDFLSTGETGYTNLTTPDVPPVFRPKDFAHDDVRPIAGLVCAALAGPDQCANWGLDRDYFDSSYQKPFDRTPGFSTRQHWEGFFKNFILPQRPFPNSEQKVQQRRFWSLSLENLDFSLTGVFINHFAATSATLGGISNPSVASQGSRNIGADHKVRFVYDYGRGTFYLLSDSSFMQNATTSGPASLSNNVLGNEAGGTLRIAAPRSSDALKDPKHPDLWARPAWLSIQYSVRYEHQLVTSPDTPFQLTATAALPSPPKMFLPTPKINTLYGRSGLHAELGASNLDVGVEEILARGLLQNYTITPAGGSAFSCQPAAGTPLICGPDLLPITEEYVLATSRFTHDLHQMTRLTPGAYLNFNWKIPLWSRLDANRADQSWYFTLTNKGDLYFHAAGETAVETRYLDKLTAALSFPIWGNLSLTPKTDFVLYENKINLYHYRALQPSVSLSYTFTRREGMDWLRALLYGAQTTTASQAGSTH